MAKILISFLGTGAASQKDGSPLREYRRAKYSIDGKEAGESSFVASVLMDHFKFDGLILIGTSKSMWEEAYRYFCEKRGQGINENIYFKLAEQVEQANHQTAINQLDVSVFKTLLGVHSNALVIPYGLNKAEQLQIFSIIGKGISQLQDGDEIVLDVTHSFRSLPLFGTTVINFIRSLSDKEIKFSKVYYGMLDAMREFDNVAPIIDISATLELQDWTTAAYAFKEYGKGQLLADLLGGEEGKIVQIFSDAVNINYLNEIKSKLTNFQALANKGFSNEFGRWVVPQVLGSFTRRLQKVGQSQYLFQYELSCWHFERQNYSAAYLVFTECIITYVCEKSSWDWLKLECREQAKTLLVKENVFGLRSIYNSANKPRKNIAHSLNKRVNEMKRDIEVLPKLQKEFLALTKQFK